MSERTDNWLRWGLGIGASAGMALSAYALQTVETMEQRINTLDNAAARQTEVLARLDLSLKRLEDKLDRYDESIRLFYRQRPLFGDDLIQHEQRFHDR
jgi:uncharacterized coiled-coil protein SlyX